VPIAISVNMLVDRLTMDAQPRWKNGQPPQSTTGVARNNSNHGNQPLGSARWTGMPGNMSAMAIESNGTVSATPPQRRRVISLNSGLSSSAAVTVRGSSAMPQTGHEPGPARTISGCMGQVYSIRAVGAGISGSSAMPQLGHGPAFFARTSGHIGQT